MPKIIDKASTKILKVSKKILFEQGYDKLSIRQVASECSIAVGTIYNYYKNKDTLIAHIMLEDWVIAINDMNNICATAINIEDGFIGIYDSITKFSNIYSFLWQQFSKTNGSANVVDNRHLMIRGQIEEKVILLLKNHNHECDLSFSPLLAELILSSVMQPDISSNELKKLIKRIFN